MCCGTHVANTGHLQAIKLLGAERGKKGKTNLGFVAGGRVLKYLGNCLDNEKALTGQMEYFWGTHFILLPLKLIPGYVKLIS